MILHDDSQSQAQWMWIPAADSNDKYTRVHSCFYNTNFYLMGNLKPLRYDGKKLIFTESNGYPKNWDDSDNVIVL